MAVQLDWLDAGGPMGVWWTLKGEQTKDFHGSSSI